MAHQITDFGEGALKRMYLPSREEYDAEVRRVPAALAVLSSTLRQRKG
jgi:hypothetical protein